MVENQETIIIENTIKKLKSWAEEFNKEKALKNLLNSSRRQDLSTFFSLFKAKEFPGEKNIICIKFLRR